MSKFILSGFGDEIADDLKVQMDVLEQNGIKHIEIRNVNGKPLVQHSITEVKDIKTELDKRGFGISSIASPIGKIGINDEFQPHLKLFRHTLEIAKVLEVKYLRMFSFFMPEVEDPRKYRKEVIDRWEQFVEASTGSGLILLHENEKEIYGDTPQRCLDLLNTINSDNFKAVFDPANFVQCKVNTYPDAFNLLEKYVVYMHIKDAVYSDCHVTPAGKGEGKIKEILTALHKLDYKGYLSIEPHLNESLPGGGPDQFKIACDALKQILLEVTGERY